MKGIEEEKKDKRGIKSFFLNMLKGVVMGVAFIIPGFSGGTVAVILGIYNGFIGAITGLFKHFKSSFFFLLPIVLGILIGALAFMIPIDLAFRYVPLPAICLFVGLMLGGTPPVLNEIKKGGKPKITHIIALIAACAVAVGICFIPHITAASSENGLSAGTYFALIGIGALAAVGCVIPGISGSMIALIFGVYELVVGSCSDLLKFVNFGQSILVVLCFGVGIIIGFFTVAFLMRYLLKRFYRGTYYAILGFITGSIFSVFYVQQTGEGLLNHPEWSETIQTVLIILGVIMAAIGCAATFIFCKFFEKRKAKIEEKAPINEKPVD